MREITNICLAKNFDCDFMFFFPISANVRWDGLVVGLNWGIACHLSHYTGDLCMISGSRQSRQGQWWMTSQEERRIWYILGYHREGMSTWHIVNYLKHGHTCSKVSPNSVSEKWAQQLYLLIYHNLFLALLWNIQKHLLNNDNELALSVQKKSKAALLTEGHCVAALKGLLEEFVHKFVYVQHQGWVHRFAYTC